MPMLPAISLCNADILTDGGLARDDLHLAGGKIAHTQTGPALNLTGYRILPGLIDLHGDGFERHMAPRRGAVQRPGDGIASLDAELAASGITTAMLAQFCSWEGGMRGPDFACKLAEALQCATPKTDLALQLRVETYLIEQFDQIEALIERFGISYLVWNDHLPHDALEQGKRPPRLTGQALKAGRSPEAHQALLTRLHGLSPQVPDAVARASAAWAQIAVRLGSHDDHLPEDRKRYRAMGVEICEFPETRAAAEEAHRAGEPVIMGAPNVVRGGSHDGKVSARELIEGGIVTALVSDYHYPSLIRAALALVPDLGWAGAWHLVSEGPARVMGWTDRGRIAEGQRADLVILNTENVVEGTICGGQVSYLSGDLAARFLEAK